MAKSSLAERNKAIREAWSKEQELVQEGKGTREWMPEQQKDILEKGRAYDDKGKTFEGQHMKSAEQYPEYQAEPGNIQFLTRAEHLEAHDGSWRNPTNWYFNPVTKEKIDFGEGPFIPCEIIQLPDPIIFISESDTRCSEEETEETMQVDVQRDSSKQNTETPNNTDSKLKEVIKPKVTPPPKSSNWFVKGLKATGRFIVEHPFESLEIAGVVIGSVAKVVSSWGGNGSGTSQHRVDDKTVSNQGNTPGVAEKIADIVEKANRAIPNENDVSAHRQRYHTKDGIVWKDKSPYHRGGNKEE